MKQKKFDNSEIQKRVDDIEKELNNLQEKSSNGELVTNIPNKLIKIAAEPLSVPFTQIYNQSIETGVVPNILKVLQVTPVYKNGDATDPANYRRISTLNF